MLARSLPVEIPQEIIFLILENIGKHDVDTLQALALVSRRFLITCRPLLFYEVDLYSDNLIRSKVTPKYRRLRQVVADNPEVAAHTKVLHIRMETFQRSHRKKMVAFHQAQLVQFLERFENIERLTVLDSDDLSQEVLDAMRWLFQRPKLKHVRLRGRCGFSMSWLQHSRLHSLHLAEWRDFSAIDSDTKLMEGGGPSYLALEGRNSSSEPYQALGRNVSKVKHLSVSMGPGGNAHASPLEVLVALDTSQVLSQMVSLRTLKCVYATVNGVFSRAWIPNRNKFTFPPTLRSLELDFRVDTISPRFTATLSALLRSLEEYPQHEFNATHLTLRIPASWMCHFARMSQDYLGVLRAHLSRYQTVQWVTVFHCVYQRAPRQSDLEHLGLKEKAHLHLDLRVALSSLYEQGRLALSNEEFDYGPRRSADSDFGITDDVWSR